MRRAIGYGRYSTVSIEGVIFLGEFKMLEIFSEILATMGSILSARHHGKAMERSPTYRLWMLLGYTSSPQLCPHRPPSRALLEEKKWEGGRPPKRAQT